MAGLAAAGRANASGAQRQRFAMIAARLTASQRGDMALPDRVIESPLIEAEHDYGWYRRFAAEARQTRRPLMETIGDRARKLYD
jgi:hypothetical protein